LREEGREKEIRAREANIGERREKGGGGGRGGGGGTYVLHPDSFVPVPRKEGKKDRKKER
jgi:hypothetical protein